MAVGDQAPRTSVQHFAAYFACPASKSCAWRSPLAPEARESIPVVGYAAAPNAQAHPIRLMRAARSSRPDKPDQPSDAHPPTSVSDDVLMHVGGSAYSLDWCPSLSSGGHTFDGSPRHDMLTLAVGSLPTPGAAFVALERHPGPGAIQLWQVPAAPVAGRTQAEFVLGLAHKGGPTRDVAWCPDALLHGPPGVDLPQDAYPRLGLLAAVLGSGDIHIYAVPKPRSVEGVYPIPVAPCDIPHPDVWDGTHKCINLDPIVRVPFGTLGSSIPNTVQWLPVQPHDLLLVGCWDGSAAVLALPSRPEEGVEVCMHHTLSHEALRWVSWLPAAVDVGHDSAAARSVFATAGQAGDVALWDARSLGTPLFRSVSFGNLSWVLGGSWVGDPNMIFLPMESGAVRKVVLCGSSPGSGDSLVNLPDYVGSVWSTAMHRESGVLVYGAENGMVAALHPMLSTQRTTVINMPLGGCRISGGVLRLSAGSDDKQTPSNIAESGNNISRYEARLEQAAVAHDLSPVYRVATSSSLPDGTWWCAAGMAAGFVRCFMMRPRADPPEAGVGDPNDSNR